MNTEYLYDIGEEVKLKQLYKTGIVLGMMTRRPYNEYYIVYASEGNRIEEWISEYELMPNDWEF